MVYKGAQITIDLRENKFKRYGDKAWHHLPNVNSITLTQIGVSQTRNAFKLAGGATSRYKVFCVYIRAGKINILAYKGKRNKVEEEAKKLSELFDVDVVDLFQRDKNGEIIDDDASKNIIDYIVSGFFIVLAITLIILIISFLIDAFN